MNIRLLTTHDFPWAMRLKAQAGWNQLIADWQRALELEPGGCFVVERDGQLLGTTTVCTFGPVAWIAMVLVEPAARGMGLGRALLEHALAYCDQAGIASVRLDATDLGRPLYEKLGFVAQFELGRYAGTLDSRALTINHETSSALPDTYRAASLEDLPRIGAFDRQCTATDRTRLLGWLLQHQPQSCQICDRGGELLGFSLARPGACATQIGPCIAHDIAGPALIRAACRPLIGQRVFIDVPLDHHAACATVEQLGLQIERRLLRMTRGTLIRERLEHLWSSCGPEKG